MTGLFLARRASSLSRKVKPAQCELSKSIQLKPGSATDILLMRREGVCDSFVLIVDDVELFEEGLVYDNNNDMFARFEKF